MAKNLIKKIKIAKKLKNKKIIKKIAEKLKNKKIIIKKLLLVLSSELFHFTNCLNGLLKNFCLI